MRRASTVPLPSTEARQRHDFNSDIMPESRLLWSLYQVSAD